MSAENVGLVTTIGSILGVLLITLGIFFYLIEKEKRAMIAIAVRTIGIGIITIMGSIPFSIPKQLLAKSTTDEISMLGVICLSIFFGAPLLFMGLACYTGLNAKAHQILNLINAQDQEDTAFHFQKKIT